MLKVMTAVSGILFWTVTVTAAETITYTYDAKGRLVRVVRTGSVNNGVITDYTHDAADNRSRVVTTGK